MLFMLCYVRRPVEDRVVHALGKAWHVEVMHLPSTGQMLT